MTTPEDIRFNLAVPFPAQITGLGPVYLVKVNGVWQIGLDVNDLAAQAPAAGSYPTDYFLMWDSIAKTYFKVSITTLLGAVTISPGSAPLQRAVTASPIVIAGSDRILNCNISSGSPTCALPASAGRNGVSLTFKDLGQAAAHNITLTPNGAEKIDGANNFVMNTNRQAVTLNPFNDGVNSGWFIT